MRVGIFPLGEEINLQSVWRTQLAQFRMGSVLPASCEPLASAFSIAKALFLQTALSTG